MSIEKEKYFIQNSRNVAKNLRYEVNQNIIIDEKNNINIFKNIKDNHGKYHHENIDS